MKSDKKTSFHERIREVRGEKTQQEVAQLLSIDKNKWWRWESGLCEPDLATLVSISLVFNVSIDWLLGLDLETDGEPRSESRQDAMGDGLKNQIRQFKAKAELAVQKATELLKSVTELEKGM